MPQPVFRFAPSPNGYLHLGHALSALLNFDMARAAGGRFLLRMEDIDATRCRPEFEAAIYEDLAWLGMSWEQPVRRQSEHFDDYRAALGKLAGDAPDVPELREPGRDRAHGGRSRRPRTLAARSRRRSGLSGRGPADEGAGPRRRASPAAILTPSASTWRRRWNGPARCAGANPAPARRRDAATCSPIPPPGATSSSAARKRRPAITSRS